MSFLSHWNKKKFRVKEAELKSKRQNCFICVDATDHDVSPADELQSGLEDEDVGDVDEVAGVVGQQPQVDVFGGLVGKRPADGDQPHVPVPCRHDDEQPDHIDQICGDRKSSSDQFNAHKYIYSSTWIQIWGTCT